MVCGLDRRHKSRVLLSTTEKYITYLVTKDLMTQDFLIVYEKRVISFSFVIKKTSPEFLISKTFMFMLLI